MNDRFKFRYTPIGENKVYNVLDLDFINKNVHVLDLDELRPILYIYYPSNLLQCTGRQDRNGTLIYEGDIIETLHLDPVRRGSIKWNDEYAQWYVDLSIVRGKAEYNYCCCELCGFDSKDIEVIGNVYENPELLSSEKFGVRREELNK